MKNVRDKFRKGERPDECATCWEDEKHGRQSKRNIFKEYVFPDLRTELHWEDDPPTPYDFQLILSNSCNLKCR